MQVFKQDGWMITTPIYVGTQEEIQKASQCKHEVFKEETRSVIDEGMMAIVERCSECVALRSRFRQASPEELAAWQVKRAEVRKAHAKKQK